MDHRVSTGSRHSGSAMTFLQSSWQFWAILAAFFAALTAIFAKVGVTHVNSDFATFIRVIVVVFALAAVLRVTGHWQAPSTVSARTYLFLVLSGLSTGVSWLCYFRALKLGEAAKVVPIEKMTIVFVALFGVVFLHERLTALGWLGLAMVGVGAVVIAVWA